ncbi:MAG TPA: ABC transporter permease subunit [Candidatus Udaeobacter sp.]|nr:ABC transporter permease subunit [Candidatus Udaeobacter sp.]
MFSSIYLKTLRGYWIPILGWGIGMGLVMVELLAGVSALISTPQARADLAAMAAQFSWNAEAIKADTPGGYATWKLGTFVFIVAIWPLLAASRTLRGEEERSQMDVLLSMPRPRWRVAVEKVAAIWTALVLIGFVIGLIAFVSALKFDPEITFGDSMLFGLNIALICAVFGGISLLISQFTRERGPAAGATGALLVVFIVVDSFHRVIPDTDWISRLSPIYYYNLSKPLIPSYGTNFGAMGLELALAVVLSAAAIWLFVHRDVGDVIPLPGWLRRMQRPTPPSRALPVRDWSLGSVYARSLGQIAMPALWWTVGTAAFGAVLVVLVEQMASNFRKLADTNPFFTQLLHQLGGSGAGFNDTLLSFVFFFMPLIVMGFAVTEVSRWATDEGDGRLEMVLATPQSRLVVILGRFAAVATASVVISLVTLGAILAVSAMAGVPLDAGNITVAALELIPMALFVTALGYLGAGWLRNAIDTGLLSFLLAAWIFITFLGPELKLPEAALKLSALYYYGTPVIHGLELGNVLVIVGIGAAALVLATLRFSRKDIGV